MKTINNKLISVDFETLHNNILKNKKFNETIKIALNKTHYLIFEYTETDRVYLNIRNTKKDYDHFIDAYEIETQNKYIKQFLKVTNLLDFLKVYKKNTYGVDTGLLNYIDWESL